MLIHDFLCPLVSVSSTTNPGDRHNIRARQELFYANLRFEVKRGALQM